jgi:hypothetical protein
MATTLSLILNASIADTVLGTVVLPSPAVTITLTGGDFTGRTYELPDLAGGYTTLEEGDVGTPRLWLLFNMHATVAAYVKIDGNPALKLLAGDFAVVPCVLGMSAGGDAAASKIYAVALA